MHVLLNGMFWHRETTGSGQYLRGLLRALLQVAPEETFSLAMPAHALPAGHTRDEPVEVQVSATPFDALHLNLAKLWFEQVAFPRICAHSAANIAHVPYFAPPYRTSLPTITTIHDLIPLLLPAYRGSRWVQAYTRLAVAAARRARLILTDSQASARDIERLVGLSADRIRVIYLAADDRYRPLPAQERAAVLARLGITAPYWLYLGGFDRRKCVPELLQAFAQASPRLDDVRLVIAGQLPQADTAFSPDPRRLATELHIQGRVHFCGRVAEEDKPALYGGALAFAFPSAYEGFGLPPLEALACGTPVLACSGSSLEEVVGPGGVIVPPNDATALADALLALTHNPAQREQLAQAGLQQAGRFSWELTARATLDAYRSLL